MTEVPLQEFSCPYLSEKLYKKVLGNGLTLFLLPKEDYHELYVAASVRFGAIHTVFRPLNSEAFYEFPAGIAHFLEHKLFELDGGQDALQSFSSLGAVVNAYTSYYKTSYLFSAIENQMECLGLLKKMIGETRFTDVSTNQEKGIIIQELEQYQDDPNSQLVTGLLSSLYPETPLAQDIVGTVDSIGQITREMLEIHFDTFYQPSNQCWFLVGKMDHLEDIVRIIESELVDKEQVRPIVCATVEKHPVLQGRSSLEEVSIPKLAIGLRGNQELELQSIYRYKIALSFFFFMLFGETSDTYHDWYEAGQIDDSFRIELEVTPAYHFFCLTADTPNPIALSEEITRILKRYEESEDLSKERFELVKKEFYGEFMRGLDSLEDIAMEFVANWHGEEQLFDFPEILSQLTFEEIVRIGQLFLDNCDMTDFKIFPK